MVPSKGQVQKLPFKCAFESGPHRIVPNKGTANRKGPDLTLFLRNKCIVIVARTAELSRPGVQRIRMLQIHYRCIYCIYYLVARASQYINPLFAVRFALLNANKTHSSTTASTVRLTRPLCVPPQSTTLLQCRTLRL